MMNYLCAFDDVSHGIRYYGGLDGRRSSTPFRIVFEFEKAHLVKESDTEMLLISLNRFTSLQWASIKAEDICCETDFTYCQRCNLSFSEKEKEVAVEICQNDMFDWGKVKTIVHLNSRLNEPLRFSVAQAIVGFTSCVKCEKKLCGNCMRTKNYCHNCRLSRRR